MGSCVCEGLPLEVIGQGLSLYGGAETGTNSTGTKKSKVRNLEPK